MEEKEFLNDENLNLQTKAEQMEQCLEQQIDIEQPAQQAQAVEDLQEQFDKQTERLANQQQEATEQEFAPLNPNCTFDKKKDEKLKNIMTIGCIPFILAAIGVSLFNIGRIRNPLSFLFLALGLLVLAIFAFVRCNIIHKACDCKACKTASKNAFQWAIIYSIVALGLIGTFIYFMVVNK